MPDVFGVSNFASDLSIDSSLSLTQAGESATTTLAEELSIDGDECKVLDGGDVPLAGVMEIDGELIYFSARFARTDFRGLLRGREGTSAAIHSAGATVKIYGPPRAFNPALLDALITMQAIIIDQQAAISELQSQMVRLKG